MAGQNSWHWFRSGSIRFASMIFTWRRGCLFLRNRPDPSHLVSSFYSVWALRVEKTAQPLSQLLNRFRLENYAGAVHERNKRCKGFFPILASPWDDLRSTLNALFFSPDWPESIDKQASSAPSSRWTKDKDHPSQPFAMIKINSRPVVSRPPSFRSCVSPAAPLLLHISMLPFNASIPFYTCGNVIG